ATGGGKNFAGRVSGRGRPEARSGANRAPRCRSAPALTRSQSDPPATAKASGGNVSCGGEATEHRGGVWAARQFPNRAVIPFSRRQPDGSTRRPSLAAGNLHGAR